MCVLEDQRQFDEQRTEEILYSHIRVDRTGKSLEISKYSVQIDENMFEFMLANGVDFFKAARSLVPAPWQNAPHMDSDLRAFYEYTATAMEAWDGPAAVAFSDGKQIETAYNSPALEKLKYPTFFGSFSVSPKIT